MLGASSLPSYDAARLVSEGDVVVVAINYRLGALGWMASARSVDTRGERSRPPEGSTGGRTFGYQFEWPARPRADGLELRACHGVDIPFTFATFSVDGWDAFVGADTDPQGAHALSAALRASWCGFARAGDPAHEGVGPWPRHAPDDRATMRLGRHPGVERDPAAARLAALAAAGVSP
jgi:carboxylesterase type B